MEKQIWSIKGSLKWAVQYLKKKKIENPQANVELIMGKVLNRDRLSLYLASESLLSPLQINKFQESIKKRAQGIPLSYIIKESYFMDFKFLVNFNVYIPRPETELLVEETLGIINSLDLREKILTLVDLGTGCGNIAISLAKNLKRINPVRKSGTGFKLFSNHSFGKSLSPPLRTGSFNGVKIYGIDISSEALAVAEKNIKLHGVEKQVELLSGDIFSPLKKFNLKGEVNGIISNPPYVSSQQMDFLPQEVRKEPRIALDGGESGLEFFKRIIPESSQYLKRKGFLIMEIGSNQENEVKKLILSQKNMKFSRIILDYQGNPRIAVAIKK